MVTTGLYLPVRIAERLMKRSEMKSTSLRFGITLLTYITSAKLSEDGLNFSLKSGKPIVKADTLLPDTESELCPLLLVSTALK